MSIKELLDSIPNSAQQHRLNCMSDCTENFFELKSQKKKYHINHAIEACARDYKLHVGSLLLPE